MRTRVVALMGVLVFFATTTAVAVGYFLDTHQTSESVKGGAPIPLINLLSQGSDATGLKYVTQSNANDLAATGSDATLALDLGRRYNSSSTAGAWKDIPENTFYRLFTVRAGSTLPGNGTVTVSLGRSLVPALSNTYAFSTLRFATIDTGVNAETAVGFKGTNAADTFTLSPNQKVQVNVAMEGFGMTSDSSATRIITTTIDVIATTSDGSQQIWTVPVRFCNHHNKNQCS